MRFLILFVTTLLVTGALAQNNERVREIRTMYAKSQQVLKDQTEDESINWSVKTTLRHNESGVGVVRYEQEYYPLHLLGAYDFVRSKRYVSVYPPTSYEILYDKGLPVFYFEHSIEDNEVVEYRIYWDQDGGISEYLPQRVVDGRKTKISYDGIEMYLRSDRAYRYAMQEYKRGAEGYDTDGNGIGTPAPIIAQSREGLYQRVNEIYTLFFTPEMMEEPDPEADGADIIGLGKMHTCVTESFNSTYCMCSSKSFSTEEVFHDYDIWVNAQDLSAHGLSGIEILQYSDTKARVAVKLWNFDSLTTVLLDLVFDPQQSTWLVNDFIDPQDGSSYMESMNRYLSE